MTICTRLVGCAALLIAAPAWAAADPEPSIGPAPSWVVPPEIPAPDPAKADAPMQLLLTASQHRIAADGMESYVQLTAMPQTTAGLQALGNVMLPWNSERTDLTLHRVTIRRGDNKIELLKPNEFLVLRRENKLERAVLDGIRTVVIPARGLETGDILDVAVTYKSRKSSVANIPEEAHSLASPVAISRVERRFLVPDGLKVQWKIGSDAMKRQINQRDGVTEHVFVQTNIEPLTVPKNTPARFKAPILQMSAYPSWSAVADELDDLFGKARSPASDSPLAAEVSKITLGSMDPAKRMLAALRLAQDRVRYVALVLGEGAYVPSSADETWERKFGDCKGKTALLLALLDQLGIEAEPVLVSQGFDDRLAEQLPSLALFDHVIVRAKVADRHYFLDPTDYGQRTLEELAVTSFRHGLPLRPQASLETFVPPPLTAPSREAALTWDIRDGTDGPVPYEATLTLRGSAAAERRAILAATTDMKEFETGLKELIPGIDNDDLVLVEKVPEAPDGSFVVRFAGEAEMDWSPFEGERNTRYAFSHATMHWDAEFDRKEGPGKEWPVSLGSAPYWERLTETVILPNGGKGYSLDGSAVEKALAGSSLSRSLRKDADRVTMVSEFRHFQREVSAEDARSAERMLEEINDDWAYVVGPPERRKKRR